MRIRAFSKRTLQEILRDPLTLAFGLGFPAGLILLLTAIQSNVPVNLFAIDNLVPGITIFGLSFMTLFSASLIAKDKESAFLARLYATPMRAIDFILGYCLPILPIALAQSVFCYCIGIFLGLQVSVNLLYAVMLILPISLFFIGLGLLFGSLLTQKQVGGICGALLTNLSAFLSGVWFDLALVGGVFEKIAQLVQSVVAGEFAHILPHLLWVLGYAAFSMITAILCFLKQMR